MLKNIETLDSRYKQTLSQSSGITASIGNLLIDSYEEERHQQNFCQPSGITASISNLLIDSYEILKESEQGRNIKKINYPKHFNDDLFTDQQHKRQKKE